VKIFCSDARVVCDSGRVLVDGIEYPCEYYTSGECLKIKYTRELAVRVTKMQEVSEMQRVLFDIFFDEIENSDAPESVKEYIRNYKKGQLNSFLKDAGL